MFCLTAIISPKNWILTIYLYFYRNILSYWENIKHINTTKRTSVSEDEIIWNNTNFKNNDNGKTVFFESWYDNGDVTKANLLDGNTNFITDSTLKDLFDYLFCNLI